MPTERVELLTKEIIKLFPSEIEVIVIILYVVLSFIITAQQKFCTDFLSF